MKTKKKRSAIKVIFTIILCLCLLSASGFFIYKSLMEAKTTISLRAEISQAKAELAALKAENEKLQNEKDKLQDRNYIENYARGVYMITKEGEEVYHLPALNSDSEGE